MTRTPALVPSPPRPVVEPLEDRRLLSGSIKGTIFVDASADGKRNNGEGAVAGITVYLDLNNNEALDAGEPVSVSDAKGKYGFKKLSKQIYHVREILPAAYAAIDPPGGAWYVDLRFKGSAGKKDFGYWPLSLGPPPVVGKGPVLPNNKQTAVLYNTGATQGNEADGTNIKPLLFGDPAEGADPYWVVQTPSADGSPTAFQPTYYSFNTARYNADLQPATALPDSTYIGPSRNGAEALAPGKYVYATAFDLTGIEPTSMEVTGVVIPDGELLEIRLNGLSVPPASQFGNVIPLSLKSGFVAGVNTLEFVVNNPGTDPSPTGLRVDALRGVGQKIKPGAITLFNTGVSTPNRIDGSNPARFSTGGVDGHWLVSTPGPGLPFYRDDAAHHFVFSNTLTNGLFGNPYVAADSADWDNSDLNTATAGVDSSFINPLGRAGAALPAGTYLYRTWFDLTGTNSDTAQISGIVAAAGSIVNIYINGAATGQGVGAGAKAGEAKPFSLTSGFVPGINVLDFVVTNPTAGGFSGLRVDGLHGTVTGATARPTIPRPLQLPLPPFPPLLTPTGSLPTG